MKSYDILFKNARVADGTGNPAVIADVAVCDGTIAGIGPHIEAAAARIIDAGGKILAPGFIDVHSHSDLYLSRGTGCMYKLLQGVTTEIAGQCGLTIAPVSEDHYEDRNKACMMSAMMFDGREKYTTSEAWHRDIEAMALGTNLSLFVGQGTIRETVMGYSDKPADPRQLEEMKRLAREAMEAGCQGISSGLAYSPGNFTPQSEIIELCKVAAEYGGIYTSHMRNQADRMLSCVAETIDVARQTGCKACISHIKSIGRPNWGNMEDAMKMIEDAQNEGLDVWCDAYPYVAGSTTLTVTLPPSLLAGGKDRLMERLRDEDTLAYIRAQFQHPTEHWENAIGSNGLESFLIIVAPSTPEAVGKRITEYAEILGIEPFDAYIKLLLENQANVGTVNFVMDENDFITAISNDLCMLGSDGNYGKGDRVTHPRSVGTFPRYLGRYARDKKLASMERAVARITGYPADKFSLSGKGYVKVGYDADLVLFDWDTIIDTADFDNCFGGNKGIGYVAVNGKLVVEDGTYNGVCNGKLIRKHKKG